jgi:hypothetical protein
MILYFGQIETQNLIIGVDIFIKIYAYFFVMFVLKTVIRRGGLLGFQNCSSLELEHSSSNT